MTATRSQTTRTARLTRDPDGTFGLALTVTTAPEVRRPHRELRLPPGRHRDRVDVLESRGPGRQGRRPRAVHADPRRRRRAVQLPRGRARALVQARRERGDVAGGGEVVTMTLIIVEVLVCGLCMAIAFLPCVWAERSN